MIAEAMAHTIIREAAEPASLFLSKPCHYGQASLTARSHQRDLRPALRYPPFAARTPVLMPGTSVRPFGAAVTCCSAV